VSGRYPSFCLAPGPPSQIFFFFTTALPPANVTQLLPISVQPPAPAVHTPPLQSSTPAAQQPQLFIGSGSGGSIITIHISATPDGTPTATPNTAPAPASTDALASLPSSSTSPTPLSPPPPVPAQSAPSPDSNATEDASSSSWKALVVALGEERLYRHKWEWTSRAWLPYYKYLPVHSITDVWTEWSSGLDGHLPVRELEERWGAKWRRNVPSQRTENG